jgi:hypothetical protein
MMLMLCMLLLFGGIEEEVEGERWTSWLHDCARQWR